MTSGPNLATYAWLSIAAAIATIALKTGAWLLTGSVGLLSDAAESVVNLVAACVALGVLRVAARPADEGHMFGHTKAEFFSAAVEGVMIFVAAVAIMVSAVQRFIHPAPLDNVGIGLGISVVASLINGAVGWLLLRAGRQHRSLTLVADGKHLLTDVVTSAGVLVGVGLVWLTGWERLDPLVAFAVGVNIIVTGWKLVTESTDGLMDSTLSAEENASIVSVLAGRTNDEVVFHGLRTRHAGRQLFATFHALVPGDWSVTRAHDLIEEIEQEIQQALPGIELEIHLEPREDPRAYNDHPVEIPIRPAEPPYAAGPPSR
ncbi:MAG: cation diffusion facilitator family transporter [Actinomycetia bacterium]|nr:cation diffusion facilitator family transporter [Actinomycetes bacterium]